MPAAIENNNVERRSKAKPNRSVCLSQLGILATFLVIWLMAALASPAQTAGDNGVSAATRAHRFLFTGQRAKEILAYVHFGADYAGYEYLRYVPLEDGDFALYYRFKWRTTDYGRTDIAFTCDSNGNILYLTVVDTDAVFNQPFLVANLSIQTMGRLLMSEYKDRLSEADLRLLRKIVDDADAKSLLEWSLKLEQRL